MYEVEHVAFLTLDFDERAVTMRTVGAAMPLHEPDQTQVSHKNDNRHISLLG